MSTVILSAATKPSVRSLKAALQAALVARGETNVRVFELATMKLAYCQGEFDCWVKTPGACRSKDAEVEIVQAIHDAESLVLLDEVTFGGHSHTLKRAQDRLICLLSPFFEKRSALTHHGSRYDKAANLFALGWMPRRQEALVQTWMDLADANAVNMVAPHVGTAVVDDVTPEHWPNAIEAMLSSTQQPGDTIHARGPLTAALRGAAQPAALSTTPMAPRTAALLVGSPKHKGTSASEVMARALALRLEQAGVTTQTHFATEFVHDGDTAQASARAIAAADVFILVTPLYVDAFPALTTHALQLVASVRAGQSSPSRFALVINCGFPEPEQCRTALAMARHFSDAAAYHWAGALPLGGGGVINPKEPLDKQYGPVEHVKKALDAAAPALARGENIPASALESMLVAPMPDVAYRIMGDLGWRYQAYAHGVAQAQLRARPLDV
jgi:multimeric flavodoxin WrbA